VNALGGKSRGAELNVEKLRDSLKRENARLVYCDRLDTGSYYCLFTSSYMFIFKRFRHILKPLYLTRCFLTTSFQLQLIPNNNIPQNASKPNSISRSIIDRNVNIGRQGHTTIEPNAVDTWWKLYEAKHSG